MSESLFKRLLARIPFSGRRRVSLIAAVGLIGYWSLIGWLSIDARENVHITLQRDAERAAEHVGDTLVFALDLAAAVFETIDVAHAQIPDPYTVAVIASPAAKSALDQLDAIVLSFGKGDQPVAMAPGADKLPGCAPPTREQMVGHGQFDVTTEALLVSYRLSELWGGASAVCAKIGAARLQYLFESSIADDPLVARLVRVGSPTAIASARFAEQTNTEPMISRLLATFPLRVEIFALPDAELNIWRGRMWPLWAISVCLTLIVAAFSMQLVRYIEAVELAATRDGLTGLLNRRYFYELAEMEFNRQQRVHGPVALLLTDVDHFKRVNDTYGHSVGDEVLREVARRLRENCRSVDLVARYGGEEFIVLLSPADAASAAHTAERLRLAFDGKPVNSERGPIPVTISIGLLSLPSGTPSSIDSMAKLADAALYRAKEGGRNRVERAEITDPVA